MNQDLNQKLAEIRNNILSITQNQKETKVNTNQQTQPQTIQVRGPRNKSNAAKIRKILRTNPNLTPKQIAEMVGCVPHAVHNVKYNLKKKKRLSKVVIAKPTPAADRLEKAVKTARIKNRAKTFGHIVQLSLSPIKTALTHFTMDLVASGNTDLLKNKHFQTLVKLTTTPEDNQL